MINLTPDEIFIITKMREVKGYANFRIEKRPDKEYPDGRLVRIVSEKSELVKD